ncbi:MAG: SGNH/GDSL hydrolase family protein [Chroococcidiopsidaceae cyanobacterium CP_BM_RX_35]|nr:SGNH/GDSL hydrolase family protein [Chroococcidiopsidaceae cyanobacterium CP_BM_RX_35]
MKNSIAAVGLSLFTFMLPLKAVAATFSSIYVFGDSLSDTGNVFNSSGNTFPPSPYFNGRFSNGPNWIDDLAQKLGLTSPTPITKVSAGVSPTDGINFAFGGATTGADNTISPAFPGLRQEVGSFTNLLQKGVSADPKALYIIWAGANDYLPTTSSFVPYTQPNTSLNNLSSAVTSLYNDGARNVLVVNLADLGKTPLALGTDQLIPGTSARLNTLTQEHNAGLTQEIQGLSQSLTGINLISLDVNSLFNQATAPNNPYGFENVTTPCFNSSTGSVCNDPSKFLFWDQTHPTAGTHQIIANAAYTTLETESVPEPSTNCALLAFGVIWAGSVFKSQLTSSNKH